MAWFVYSFGLACFGWGLGALSLDARLAEQGGAPPADAFGLQDGYLMIFVILGGMLLAMLQLFLTCIWMIQRFRKVEDRLVGTRLFAK